jgi:serine/threonine-protein kinase RsbW
MCLAPPRVALRAKARRFLSCCTNTTIDVQLSTRPWLVVACLKPEGFRRLHRQVSPSWLQRWALRSTGDAGNYCVVRQDSRTFPARMDAFLRVAAFLEEACAATLGAEDSLKVRLIVEELFTNTIKHGYGQDCDQPVIITITGRDGEVALTYEDTAPPYNPFSVVRAPDESATVEQRPVGGMGVVLIAHMARHVEYCYSQGRNRISLVVGTGR